MALAVLDVLDQGFLKLSLDTGDTSHLTEGRWEHPASVHQTGNEIWVYDHGRLAQPLPGPRGKILRLDGRLRPSGRLAVEDRALGSLEKAFGPEAVVKAIYGWYPWGDGVLAFADVSIDDGRRWESAFLYFDDQGHQEVFHRLPTTAQVCNHYTRNADYVAAIGDVGYILFLDPTPSLAEVRRGVSGFRELPLFPEDFRSRPRLDTRQEWARTRQGARQATTFYEILESSTMVAGLYAWNEHLYLLGKHAITEDGRTAWWLVKLDPADGAELARVRLPTDAAHLTVVPGAEFWALVEKGPVQGIGDQHAPYMETSSVVLVPTPWLETPSSGGLDPEVRAHCTAFER